jgi:hypothetical protein
MVSKINSGFFFLIALALGPLLLLPVFFTPVAHAQQIDRAGLSSFFDSGSASQDVVTKDVVTKDVVTDEIEPGRGLPPRAIRKHDHFRGIFGVGGNLAFKDVLPLAMGGSLAYQRGSDVYSASFMSASSTGRGASRTSYHEFDLLYGYAISGYDLGFLAPEGDGFYAAFSLGLGYEEYSVRTRFRRGFPPPIDSTGAIPPNSYDGGIGVPIQIQASYSPFAFLGLGVTLFADVNKLHTNYGALLSVQVGYY